jgi:tetratricopeptide (TPR) repeat protein/tRNA A-37 threonylcarbamoyl transferase component Bud32
MDDTNHDLDGQPTRFVDTVDVDPDRTVAPSSGRRGSTQAGERLLGHLVGNIRLESILGQGGMGTVYQGVDEKLGRVVAVKSIRAGTMLDEQTRARFLREAQVLSHLNHPNICQVFDFVQGEGDDYLVLEFVQGAVLTDAIQDGLPRPRGLGIAVQLADVLTLTHSRGIIHRDLKPDNVMLTADDQVKVLDFGLARHDEHEAPLPATSAPRSMSDSVRSSSVSSTVETVLGTVMGTVGYMSPEQARGEPASPASDIYSLGLVLQELFTGAKPFNPTSTVQQVLLETRVGRSPAAEGLPADLAQLIERMKSLLPEDRPTAPDVAHRLRRIIDKPARRARWAAVAVVVAALVGGSVKYVIDLNRERTVALEAQADALAARDDAEELMGFVLEDLYAGLQPLGRLDLLGDVANQALSYYTSENLRGEMTDEGLIRRSIALRNLGGVFEDQGQLDAAESAYRGSLRIAEALAQRDGTNSGAILGEARAHIGIAGLALQRNKPDAALASYARASEHLENLIGSEPSNPGWNTLLANTLTERANVLFTVGRSEDALNVMERATAMTRDLVDADADDAALQLALGTRYRLLSQILDASGNADGARQASDEDIAICTTVASTDPTNSNARLALLEGYSWRGHLLMGGGDLEAAEAALRSAVRVGERLVADDPTHTYRRFRLSATHDFLGQVLQASGNLRAALGAYEEALVLMEAVAAVDASNEVFLNDLAYSHLQVGRAEAALGRAAAARRHWEEGARVVAPIADENGLPPIQETYALALLLLGRADEARPVMLRVIEAGWQPDAGTMELARDLGIDLP